MSCVVLFEATKSHAHRDDYLEKEGKTMKLQNAILQELIHERVPVTVYLMNGFQLRGTITGCDEDVLVIVVDGKQQMLYKHGISTIAPIRPLRSAASL